MERTLDLTACLNGDRTRTQHPAVPLSAGDLARDAARAIAAGAADVHIHPRDASGRETFGRVQHAAAIAAVREAVPAARIGVTTIATVERDPKRRVELVRKWTERPDVASVNWSEDGAPALVSALVEREVAIEAGICTVADAERFAASELARFCVRVLVEPTEPRAADALASAERIVALLRPLGLRLCVHGHERTTWPLLRWAVAHGHDIRIGLEDTLSLEGGRIAADNAELVAAAARMRP